jgi:hypothetical protein
MILLFYCIFLKFFIEIIKMLFRILVLCFVFIRIIAVVLNFYNNNMNNIILVRLYKEIRIKILSL